MLHRSSLAVARDVAKAATAAKAIAESFMMKVACQVVVDVGPPWLAAGLEVTCRDTWTESRGLRQTTMRPEHLESARAVGARSPRPALAASQSSSLDRRRQ